MGVGKTVVGRSVAATLGWPFRDTDLEIESATGGTGAEFAERHGVPALHRLEAATFMRLAASGTPSVIAAAASVVEHSGARTWLERTTTVWLDARAEVVAQRRSTDGHRRRVSEGEAERLRARRSPLLARIGATRIDTSDRTVTEVATTVVAAIGLR